MTEERLHVDPDGRYPADGLRSVEEHAARVIELLPGGPVERTRDVIQINQGGELGIVVVVTAEALELRLPTIEWTNDPTGPADSSRLWKRVEWDRIGEDELPDLLAQLQAARRSEFRECPYCRLQFPPERSIDGDVCHGCAETHLQIVF